MTTTSDPLSEPDCGGCTLHVALNAPAVIERREFLRVGAMALASLGLLGIPVGEAHALAMRPGDRPEEKRYPVPAADVVSIDKDNSVIVARAGGKVYAFSLSCPHQNTALRWNADDKLFTCPKHKSHYRADGSFIDGRATRDMDRLAVRRDGQALVVDVDVLYQQDLNQAQWSAAFIQL